MVGSDSVDRLGAGVALTGRKERAKIATLARTKRKEDFGNTLNAIFVLSSCFLGSGIFNKTEKNF